MMPYKSEIKALPTWYSGILFRSRLEARWAVFLDALGVKWSYEPETFELPSGKYTPDFHLHDLKSYIEIKPNIFVGREGDKCHELADYLNSDIEYEDYDDRFMVYVIYGDITIPSLVDRNYGPLNMECEGYEGSDGDPHGEFYWAEDLRSRDVNILHMREICSWEHYHAGRSGCQERWIYDSPRLCKAYFLARTFSFEETNSNLRAKRIRFQRTHMDPSGTSADYSFNNDETAF